MTACAVSWPLLDPNEEDLATGNTHACYLNPNHAGDHLCVCGDTLAREDRASC